MAAGCDCILLIIPGACIGGSWDRSVPGKELHSMHFWAGISGDRPGRVLKHQMYGESHSMQQHSQPQFEVNIFSKGLRSISWPTVSFHKSITRFLPNLTFQNQFQAAGKVPKSNLFPSEKGRPKAKTEKRSTLFPKKERRRSFPDKADGTPNGKRIWRIRK